MTALQRSLAVIGAREPGVDDVAAIRAIMRGQASPGQQRRAVTYLMIELCGVGAVPFAGEHTHGAAFKAGAMAVGIAMAQIADVVLMSFPNREDPPEQTP